MKVKPLNTYSSGFAECETQDISPLKKQTPSTLKNLPIPQSQLTTQHNSKKPSRTQQQIYSHELISSIMNKRFHNTVKHNVGQFDADVQLYAKPIQKSIHSNPMMEFSDQKQMYQSEYTKRVNDINTRLNHGKTLSERVNVRKQENKVTSQIHKNKSKRPASAGQSTSAQSVHKKISVSGLVSYNFNSVNARKNLGFNFQHDQQKLSNMMTKLQTRNKCCSTRQQSFVEKKQKHKANIANEIKRAIFGDFQTRTGTFLNNLHEQIKEQQTIYGTKWSKLLCIKQMMEKQNIGYHEAQTIVQQIETKKQEIKIQKQQKKLQRNDELQLDMRKQVVRKGKVMIKQLYFID